MEAADYLFLCLEIKQSATPNADMAMKPTWQFVWEH